RLRPGQFHQPRQAGAFRVNGARHVRLGVRSVLLADGVFVVIHGLLPESSFWFIAVSERPGVERYASKFARILGQSSSIIANQAVSRFLPLTIMCWRKTPSGWKPSRWAARLLSALALSHFHSTRR